MGNIVEFTVKGEYLFEVEDKKGWNKRIAEGLHCKKRGDRLLWVDANGNCATLGQDFMAAKRGGTYPIKVYRLQRIFNALEGGK